MLAQEKLEGKKMDSCLLAKKILRGYMDVNKMKVIIKVIALPKRIIRQVKRNSTQRIKSSINIKNDYLYCNFIHNH